MKLKEPRFFVFYGPTGVGKTDVALQFANAIPSEIVNMDMGQCYTPLTIGTAKPLWQAMQTPHHLFDILHEPYSMTVVEYRERCLAELRAIWSRGNLPILVGGSGFYLHALLFPVSVHQAIVDSSIAHVNHNSLWNQLNSIDPDRAAAIHPNDSYRLERALNIWYSTGKKPSTYLPHYQPPAPYTVHCLLRNRNELYDRINKRVLCMIQDGWIEEAQSLLGTGWESFLYEKKIIGYPALLDYITHRQNLQTTIAFIQQKTRNYAKRQISFWNKLEKDLRATESNIDIAGINLTLLDVDLYIKQLLKKVNTWFS